MIYSLPKFARRLLAVGLLVAPLGALGYFVANPIVGHIGELKEQIEQERLLAGRLTALTGDDSAKRALEQQTKQAKASGLFIEGESESIRFAALQSNISAIAGANGVKLRSARNLPARDKNELRLVGVQLQLTAPIDKLQKILLDIEQHKPALFVEFLQITPAFAARSVDDEVGMLEARFDVYAVESRQKG